MVWVVVEGKGESSCIRCARKAFLIKMNQWKVTFHVKSYWKSFQGRRKDKVYKPQGMFRTWKQKSFYWKAAKVMTSTQVLQNLNFCLKAWMSSLAANTVSCFSWNDRLALFIFKKMSIKYTSLNNYSLAVVVPHKNYVLCKKWLV